MKKILALLLSLLMVFTFAACEKEDVELAVDIAVAVMDELEKYEEEAAESDVLPEYDVEGAESVEEIPEFTDEAYVAVNDNIPFFLPEEYTTESYEYYSELDELGRCGVTMACIGIGYLLVGTTLLHLDNPHWRYYSLLHNQPIQRPHRDW